MVAAHRDAALRKESLMERDDKGAFIHAAAVLAVVLVAQGRMSPRPGPVSSGSRFPGTRPSSSRVSRAPGGMPPESSSPSNAGKSSRISGTRAAGRWRRTSPTSAKPDAATSILSFSTRERAPLVARTAGRSRPRRREAGPFMSAARNLPTGSGAIRDSRRTCSSTKSSTRWDSSRIPLRARRSRRG